MFFRSYSPQYLIYVGMRICALLKSLLNLKYKTPESPKNYITDYHSPCHRSKWFLTDDFITDNVTRGVYSFII